jgi:hypothetical protein
LKAEIDALKKQPGATTAPVNKAADNTTEEPVDEFDAIKSARETFNMLP